MSISFRANFKSGKLTHMAFLQSAAHRMLPLKDVKDEEKILKGFVWRPKDRPVSKEAILPPLLKSVKIKATPPKSSPAKKPVIKAELKKTALVKPNKDIAIPKTSKDGTAITPSVVVKKDTVVKKQ